MQVSIDWELCVGAGRCVACSPEAFELVRVDGATRAILAAPAQADDALLAAAQACPTLAIRVTDAEGTTLYPVARA